ncbi:hypothetical protein TNCV_1040331 [Trichonephila clavipes]|nr:hypothetical protein TNCV_1040331 [Trichonephila clavipes]
MTRFVAKSTRVAEQCDVNIDSLARYDDEEFQMCGPQGHMGWIPLVCAIVALIKPVRDLIFEKKNVGLQEELIGIGTNEDLKIVRVQYFVRGGFVGYRSRASSKASLLSSSGRRARFFGVKQGLRCTCKMHVWVSGPQRKPTRC